MVVNTNVVTNITVPKLAVAIAVPLVVIIALIALCFGCYVYSKRSTEPTISTAPVTIRLEDIQVNTGVNYVVDPNAR